MSQAGDKSPGPGEPAAQDEGYAFSDEVLAAVDSGHKIEAIKQLREETGMGLADAKTAIDALARDRRGVTPSHSAQLPEEGGAGGVIRLVVLIAAVLAVYFYFLAP